MRPFAYYRALDERDACEIAAARPGAAYIAGGTDFMQLWKAGASSPELVIDISRLPLDHIAIRDGTLRIGALARIRDVAEHPLIRSQFPRGSGCKCVAPVAQRGHIVNDNLLDYLIPVHADMPRFDIHLVEEDDAHIAGGIKGIGMLGTVGTAGAIANAVFHASGRRIRHLPIRPEHFLIPH